MQGFAVSLHQYECPGCGTSVRGIAINSNVLQGVFIALGVVGLIALVAAALE